MNRRADFDRERHQALACAVKGAAILASHCTSDDLAQAFLWLAMASLHVSKSDPNGVKSLDIAIEIVHRAQGKAKP